MAALKLQLITPTGTVFDGVVNSVTAPGLRGRFGILTRHAPMISALQQGLVHIARDSDEVHVVIGDGLLEVADNTITILSGIARQVASDAEAASVLALAREQSDQTAR